MREMKDDDQSAFRPRPPTPRASGQRRVHVDSMPPSDIRKNGADFEIQAPRNRVFLIRRLVLDMTPHTSPPHGMDYISILCTVVRPGRRGSGCNGRTKRQSETISRGTGFPFLEFPVPNAAVDDGV